MCRIVHSTLIVHTPKINRTSLDKCSNMFPSKLTGYFLSAAFAVIVFLSSMIGVRADVAVAPTIGSNVTISVFADGAQPFTYQWKKDNIDIGGATAQTYTITNFQASDYGIYTAVVTNSVGSTTSDLAVFGGVAPIITTQPVTSQSVTWGSTVNMTVAASGTPAPNFQWRKDGVNLTNNSIVSGATTSTLTLTGVTGAYAGTYSVVVDNSVAPAATSNASTLTVNGIPVTITSQPASQAVQLGHPVSFSVSATGTPAPSFQWNKNNVQIPGATGSTYSIGSSTANDAGSYSVTITNIVGSVTSATATLSVSVVPVPTITSQPVALTVAAGRNVSFQIATVDAVSFQWQVSPDGGTTWNNLSNDATYSGVTSKTLTIANAPLSLNSRLYRAQAGNGTGGATSNAVTLGVTTPVFPSPVSVVVSPTGNLVVSDRTQNVIQSVNSVRVANLLAGVANQQGSTNGNGNIALFRQPGGAVLDSAGNLYVADTGNSMIRKITPTGTVSTLAGSANNQSYRDGNGTDAWFNSPSSVTIDGGGSLYVADTGNSVIRKIDLAGNVTTFAGTAGVRGSVDGNGPAARFNQPTGIAADTGGNLFVADTLNQVIRKISPNGAVSTLAGLTGVSGSADGTGADALFNNPLGVAVDSLGNIYVSDSGNATIRRISSTGVVSTYAGLPTISGLMDGTGLDAWFNQPMGLGMDSAGNLYVADNGNAAVRRISSGRVVNTLVITQGTTPIPTPPPTTPTTPTPTPPTSPTPAPSSGSGGGGGVPSLWFMSTLAILFGIRLRTRANV
jgi:hypothetical protein